MSERIYVLCLNTYSIPEFKISDNHLSKTCKSRYRLGKLNIENWGTEKSFSKMCQFFIPLRSKNEFVDK